MELSTQLGLFAGAALVLLGEFRALKSLGELKRLMAYSALAQAGYILVGMSTGALAGTTGALLHLLYQGAAPYPCGTSACAAWPEKPEAGAFPRSAGPEAAAPATAVLLGFSPLHGHRAHPLQGPSGQGADPLRHRGRRAFPHRPGPRGREHRGRRVHHTSGARRVHGKGARTFRHILSHRRHPATAWPVWRVAWPCSACFRNRCCTCASPWAGASPRPEPPSPISRGAGPCPRSSPYFGAFALVPGQPVRTRLPRHSGHRHSRGHGGRGLGRARAGSRAGPFHHALRPGRRGDRNLLHRLHGAQRGFGPLLLLPVHHDRHPGWPGLGQGPRRLLLLLGDHDLQLLHAGGAQAFARGSQGGRQVLHHVRGAEPTPCRSAFWPCRPPAPHAGITQLAAALQTFGPAAAAATLLLLLAGFTVKAGFFPLHSWLPAAHPVAPSSISRPPCPVF